MSALKRGGRLMARPSPQLGRYKSTTNAAEHLVNDFSDRLKGLPPFAVRARKHEDVRLVIAARHVDEHGRGAFHVAGKQEPREGNRVAF
jgi:hypothetical protein